MSVLLVVAALLVVATKLADCLTTLRAVPRVDVESNPIGRGLMRRFGIAGAVWLVLLLVVVVVAGAAIGVAASDDFTLQVSFVLVAGVVSLVQAAVAHTNATGRWNVVTSRVLAWHRFVGGCLGALQTRLARRRRG